MTRILPGVLIACCALPCWAQYEATPAAKALDQKGHDAETNGRYTESLADYRQAISLDPNYADAYGDEIEVAPAAAIHERFANVNQTDPRVIREARAIDAEVIRNEVNQFEESIRQHPGKPIYLWALAQIYLESDPLKVQQYCRKAVAVDPRFGLGYECLAYVVSMRGDDKEYSALIARAARLEPGSERIAALYAQTLKGDPVAYKAATMDLLRRFPTDPDSVGALYYYAVAQKTELEEVKWLERLQQQFPPEQYLWSEMAGWELFRVEDRTDPAKARALAEDMARRKPQGDDWAEYTGYADAMAKAEQELDQGHAAEAVVTLKSVKSPYYGWDTRREVLLNARARDASAGPADAYACLLDAYATYPTDEVRHALEAYGAKLGRSAAELDAAVWAAMQQASRPAIPFTLQGLNGGKPVSLSDYRGHVVLVDFWFPGCGPCRESMPRLEELAHKYSSRGVVILAINNVTGQAPFVPSFLRSHGYDFIPLEVPYDHWGEKVYHIHGYPTTFVIGADGRQYFEPRFVTDLQERAAELEIDELLAHAGG